VRLPPHLRRQVEAAPGTSSTRSGGTSRGPRKAPAGRGPASPPDPFLAALAAYCAQKGHPAPEPEHHFHPERLWRFDYAFPAARVALEVEGLTYSGGRHQRLKGYEQDCHKYNAAVLAGWLLVRCTTRMVRSGEVFDLLDAAFKARRPA
jgi:hypothetical protein